MADPRGFISFDIDHNETQKTLFAGQAKNNRTPFSFEDWSSKSSLPQNQWERIIHEKIGKCNFLVALVGKNMASATGVSKEISFADAQKVPVFGVYVDNANSSSTLPDGLPRNRTIDWDWDNIAAAVNQVINEGKNER
jgi:hypothetical protein